MDDSRISQPIRDACALLLLLIVVFFYHCSLRYYLRGLDRPLVLEVSFFVSLLIACAYEIKGGLPWRLVVVGCLMNGLVFWGGAWSAEWFRTEYVSFISMVKDDQEFVAWIGEDLHSAFTARVVGYGGCFALGLLVMRLTVGRAFVRKLLTSALILPVHRPSVCPCCGRNFD